MNKKLNVFASVAVASAVLVGGVVVGGAQASAADGGEYKPTKGHIKFVPFTGITPPVDPDKPDTSKPVIPINPMEPDAPVKDGTNGPLSIDFASTFEFGEHEISNDRTYYAKPQSFKEGGHRTEDGANYVQVTDNRGTEAGWTLKVTQDAQLHNSDKGVDLEGAKITLLNLQANTISTSASPKLTSSLDNGKKVELVPGAEANLAAASDGSGAGTHTIAFGDNATAAKSVELEVPQSTAILLGDYETTFTWTLTDVPGV